MSIIASRIKSLREEKGLSQKELGKKITRNQTEIAYFENDSRKPKIEDILALAKLFNVSTDYLLGATDSKSSDATNIAISKRLGLNDEAIANIIFCCSCNEWKYKELFNSFISNERIVAMLEYINIYKDNKKNLGVRIAQYVLGDKKEFFSPEEKINLSKFRIQQKLENIIDEITWEKK